MPISIECILESAVFFPGDTIFCRIFISNLGGFNETTSSNSVKQSQTISWITAQVYGNLMVESSFIKLNSNKSNKSKKNKQQQQQTTTSTSTTTSSSSPQQDTSSIIDNSNRLKVNKYIITTGKKFTAGVSSATSLPNLSEIGENGKPIFTSPTTFLASELYIPPGQTKSFIYYLTLPSPLPPSFKGTSLKYNYFLSIASQVFTNPAQILTVPIRILTPGAALRPIKYKSNMLFDFEEGSAETTQEYSTNAKNNLEAVTKWPISPFKKSQYFPLPYPQNVSQYDSNNTKKSVIDILNKHSTPVSIVISKGTDKIATFSICKTAFSLGDSVHGTFDFSIATIPCFKIQIKLECEEVVDSKYLLSTRGNNKPIRKLYGELHEFTCNQRQTHFMFHIPVEASQEFSTKYLSVKWSLRFEFVTPIKASYIPYQPTTTTNTSDINKSSSNSNLPTLVTPQSTSSPSTPVISPIKSSNINNNNEHIPKSRSFTDNNNNNNNHSRNNSVDNLAQHVQAQAQQRRDQINRDNDDDDDNQSSHSENAIINDDSLSNSGSSFSSSTTNSKLNTTNSSGNILSNSNQQIPQSNNNSANTTTSLTTIKKKKLFQHPNIGILRDDNSVPLVDTLHWSLPIRVLVGFPPHELLHTNKNELIL